MTTTVLDVDTVTKSFGGLVAVDGVSMSIEEGSIVGLIGPNGAGKTTLLNLISGFYEPDSGSIALSGVDITDLPPYERARRGMIRTFQITKQLSGMKTIDNMYVAYPDDDDHRVIRQLVAGPTIEEERYDLVRSWLETLDLWHVRDEYAGNLSGGQQKLLELGRALVMAPDLLLLDEPMAGINPALTDDLLEIIHDLRQDGMTFLVIEHDMDVIMSISDVVVVMDEGTILTSGPPEEVQNDEAVLETYLGGG
jgi:branched-chain amino acid transport system ATP-binding protein